MQVQIPQQTNHHPSYKFPNIPLFEKQQCLPSLQVRGKKWKNHHNQHSEVSSQMCTKLLLRTEPPQSFCPWNNHVADDDNVLKSSVLFTLHMQSGQGYEYIESFCLLSSIPFKSLCDRILSICLLKLFHLRGKQDIGINWTVKKGSPKSNIWKQENKIHEPRNTEVYPVNKFKTNWNKTS